MLNRQIIRVGAACPGGWAAYGQKVAENMFNSITFMVIGSAGCSNHPCPRINQKPFRTVSSRSCGERFRIVFILKSYYQRKPKRYGYRRALMRSHVFIPFQGSETDLILNGK